MNRFLKNIALYVLVVVMIVILVETLRIHSRSYVKTVNGSEVYCAIGKSQMKKKVKKLVLGDSVGGQLYSCYQDYDSVISLACNQAITMAGQYFLLKEFIAVNANDLPEEVILLMSPFSLVNDVDEYAYHYFLKPFPPFEYSRFYTKHLKQRIQSIPFYWTANLPLIKTSNYTPRRAIPCPQSGEGLSFTSYEYLLKMDSLASANNLMFRMVSPPVRDDRREEVESIWVNTPTIFLQEMDSLLRSYRLNIEYLPADYYYDQVHFLISKIPVDYLKLLQTC